METCVLPELANCWRRVRDWRGPWVPVAEFPDSPVAPFGTLGLTTSWRLLTLALSSVDPATSVAFCRAGRGIVGTASMEPTTKMVPTITAISISYKIEGDIIHSIKRSLDNPSHESSYLIIKMELSCGLSAGNRCISEQIWRAVATWLTSSLHCAAYVCSQQFGPSFILFIIAEFWEWGKINKCRLSYIIITCRFQFRFPVLNCQFYRSPRAITVLDRLYMPILIIITNV